MRDDEVYWNRLWHYFARWTRSIHTHTKFHSHLVGNCSEHLFHKWLISYENEFTLSTCFCINNKVDVDDDDASWCCLFSPQVHSERAWMVHSNCDDDNLYNLHMKTTGRVQSTHHNKNEKQSAKCCDYVVEKLKTSQ